MAAPNITSKQVLVFVRKFPLAIACGVLSLAMCVFYYFRSDAIPEARDELEAKNTEAQRLSSNIKNANQLKEQADIVLAASKLVDTRVVRASALGTNLQYFYKIEKDTGTKLTDLKQNPVPIPKDKKPLTTYVPVPYTVSVQGDYPHLISFLRQIENGQNFCRIISASISAPKMSQGGESDIAEGVLSLTVNLELVGLP